MIPISNYYCVVRSNYFHVKDEEKFRALMAKAMGDEDEIMLWDDETDQDGNRLFGFGVYSGISGVPQDDCGEDEYGMDEDAYDRFIDGLKECVADDDAIIIFEAGHEKLRYVVGSALVVTSHGSEYIDIQNIACDKARQMLGSEQWHTKCEY